MELIQENVSALAGKLGFDAGVITKFLTDASATEEVKPFADTLGLLEIFKPDELTTRIGNERKAATEEAERIAKGNSFGLLDKRILQDTGIAKKEGESTVEYMARASKEKYGTKANESEEITRLRGEIQAKDDLLKKKDTELQEIEVKHTTERKQGQINADLDKAINDLSIDIDEKYLPGQRKLLKVELADKYDIDVVDGKVQFTDKVTKEVKRDPKTGNPMTAAALVAEFAPSVVSLKKEPSAKGGSGFKGSDQNLNDGAADGFDFSKYTSKEEFASALNKQGISSGSKRGGELYAAFEKARPDIK